MDIQLKERVVGAVVLVLAAVIFIPVVLDGPATDARVTRSVTLPAADNDGRRTLRIDLDADAGLEAQPVVTAEEPVSIDLSGDAAQDVRPQPGSQVSAPVESRAQAPAQEPPATAVAEPDAPAPSARQPWTVQVGSFGNDGNAERLAAELRELGFPAYVSRFDDGNAVHHRVRVGGFASREAAEVQANAIRTKTGQPARPARNP